MEKLQQVSGARPSGITTSNQSPAENRAAFAGKLKSFAESAAGTVLSASSMGMGHSVMSVAGGAYMHTMAVSPNGALGDSSTAAPKAASGPSNLSANGSLGGPGEGGVPRDSTNLGSQGILSDSKAGMIQSLKLQYAMNALSEKFGALSAADKARHDAVMSMVQNFR